MNKMKVALINHFSNSEVREQLDLFGGQYRDLGGWNNNIIAGLKKKEDIDLHVITPHRGMRYATQKFVLDGVHYYFFRQDLPNPWGQIEARFWPQYKRGFPRNRKYVRRFLSEIKPDIVNLIGAENAYYSITALDVVDIPIIIHCQTVYANPDRMSNSGKIEKYRWDTELKLFHKTPYLACNSQRYYTLIKKYEPDAIIFPRKWPAPQYPDIPEVEKKYDFVYFARFLNKNKGFDNAVEAFGKFVKIHPKARFLAIGSKDNDWPDIERRIDELGINDSLTIQKTIPDYRETLKFVRQGRFALLPITMDMVSGTILESMRMGLPVLTCRTSGTPSLNEKRETVLISNIGDSDGLCHNMRRLYENPELQRELQDNGYLYIQEMDLANSRNTEEMIAQYKAVIDNYRHKIPIPEEMLFDKSVLFM